MLRHIRSWIRFRDRSSPSCIICSHGVSGCGRHSLRSKKPYSNVTQFRCNPHSRPKRIGGCVPPKKISVQKSSYPPLKVSGISFQCQVWKRARSCLDGINQSRIECSTLIFPQVLFVSQFRARRRFRSIGRCGFAFCLVRRAY